MAILSKFCPQLSDLNRGAPLPDRRAQKVFVACVHARVCARRKIRVPPYKRGRHRAHVSEKHACLPQPAKAAITAVFINSSKARESPRVTPSPNCFLLKQKTIMADCTPCTLDAVKDFAGCYTKTSHAVFTELNISFFFFLPFLP